MRIPNVLQNLFGEGVLSASFIPVYAKLTAEGDRDEAGRVAGAVFSLLALVTSILVVVGVLATPYLIEAIAPGFHGERRRLAIQLVRIVFPGVGLLVLSAWCLGILNSHRKFFLSYAAPIVWNISMIVALLAFGWRSSVSYLAVYVSWALVIGSALQFLVQLPTVLKLAPTLRFAFAKTNENVRTVIRNFIPAFLSRGVVQISAYVDQMLGNMMTEAVVPTLLHEDPRYFRRGSGSKLGRTAYALTRIFVTRTDAGANRINSSELLGNSIAVAISNAYYPAMRNAADNLEKLALQCGTDSLSNMLKEFWPDIKRKLRSRHEP